MVIFKPALLNFFCKRRAIAGGGFPRYEAVQLTFLKMVV
jgi:hypothetical protein